MPKIKSGATLKSRVGQSAIKKAGKKRRSRSATVKAHKRRPKERRESRGVELKEPALPAFTVVKRFDQVPESNFSRDLLDAATRSKDDDDCADRRRRPKRLVKKRENRYLALYVSSSDDYDEEDKGEVTEGLIKRPTFFGVSEPLDYGKRHIDAADDGDDL